MIEKKLRAVRSEKYSERKEKERNRVCERKKKEKESLSERERKSEIKKERR